MRHSDKKGTHTYHISVSIMLAHVDNMPLLSCSCSSHFVIGCKIRLLSLIINLHKSPRHVTLIDDLGQV